MKSYVTVLGVSAVLLAGASNADAIVRGHGAGALSRHVVRLVGSGGLSCSATVVGPQEVLTSSHCLDGSDPYLVVVGGRHIRVASYTNAGSVARLVLATALPRSHVPIALGDAGEGPLTIAGYGTAIESTHPRTGALRAATLIAAGTPDALVDPNHRGASACMGDSGGPVARFAGRRYVLVGIIERASNPSPTKACGDLTHYASVGGFAPWSAPATTAANIEPRHRVHLRARRVRRAAR